MLTTQSTKTIEDKNEWKMYDARWALGTCWWSNNKEKEEKEKRKKKRRRGEKREKERRRKSLEFKSKPIHQLFYLHFPPIYLSSSNSTALQTVGACFRIGDGAA